MSSAGAGSDRKKAAYTKCEQNAQKFNAYVPSKGKAPQSAAQPDKKYDPRDFLDDAARKRVQEIIKASREKNQEQLRKEGKGLGMFINDPRRN